MATIVLASSSPRRAELMRRVGLGGCEAVSPRAAEDFEEGLPPGEVVARLSRDKAENVAARRGPDDIVVAADTLVWVDGRILGKPADAAEARDMLGMLSGRWHLVYTGLTVRRGSAVLTETEVTRVRVRALTDGEIRSYVETGEPMDKAGGYGIQERGALLVERIEGDYFNVMGLPLCRLGRMLKEMGVDLLKEDEG